MNEVKNIFCIGRNYAKHAVELGNEVPEAPILFTKPTHALTYAIGEDITFPADKGEIHHELEIILHIDKPVKKGDRLEDVVSDISLGIDFTLRDVQSELKKKGQPWDRAKGFPNAAVTTERFPFPGIEACRKETFSLLKNGEVAQEGTINEMMFDFQAIIDECQEVFGLGAGDLIYTGTPEGVGPIKDGDQFEFFWGSERIGSFIVSMK
ncbi:fumarylacetoacetate hydrolase [Alkalihalophilus pseudofirmus]|uniref:Fumarylacetoacetate hydrolase family protein n=1 Tax=Alkalihalophilus pseudofirmus TaxID=79885 RepID=A0AAJ2NR65_ALKPS|nr:MULTISPECIES: fumarylacetoacetate hydrolase family protein [Alkalihalophilus]MDV2886822.1 fumarylacetoacetate hydrolase family protein [Alkalihalophilus pseudofirmus]MED1600555.1 fumarylacetoacetate hydrolase family protein [Alkalihalophilus marmarensis]OLS36693.1 fumarylacetoacetate hydrolase [Alkalihalophilus pseudofirmus]